jgi:hypothetical protein
MAFDEARTTLYINDVGGQLWEEIDEGKSGANYGWNRCEGTHKTNSVNEPCDDPRFVAPVFEYRHQETPQDGDLELKSITGGAFVPDDARAWPDKFRGGYLFADLGGGIYLMDPGTEPERTTPQSAPSHRSTSSSTTTRSTTPISSGSHLPSSTHGDSGGNSHRGRLMTTRRACLRKW